MPLHVTKNIELEDKAEFIAAASGTAVVFEEKVKNPTGIFEFEKKKYPFRIDV